MSDIVVKVCGLTSPDDARFCAKAGVQMLGLNFSPQSVRCLTEEKAREIISAVRNELSELRFIGLFVDQPANFVQEMTDALALDGVQLHGKEAPEFLGGLRAPFVIKALRVGPDFRLTNAYNCDAILLDTWNAHLSGGTGETFDWSIAAQVRPHVRRLILAGGLRPENVGEAIRIVRPFAVDVCSGVEDAPGRKSESKVRRFIEAVRTTEKIEATA
jgi:phosphoribosylanthranilate isomerase